MSAAALTAWSIGIAERLPLSGTCCEDLFSSRVVSTDKVEEDEGANVVILGVPVRLAFERDFRIVGVSKDSRAFGSSSLVYLPIDGLWTTYKDGGEVRR